MRHCALSLAFRGASTCARILIVADPPAVSRTVQVLAVVLHYSFAFEGSALLVFMYDIQELLWTFSIYLESVAILPQLFLLQRTGEAEALTADYVFCLGGYRFLYIFNWIWRAAHTPGYQDWIVWVSGFIQTALYGDFFYYYVKCKYYGGAVKLPQ
eukprot:COSAG02_NODE_2412_length_8920_cov_2.506178_4_plen_156_part_00